MSYGLNVLYTLKPGMRAAYLADIAAKGIQTAVRAEDGCLRYDYFLSVEKEDQLLLVEQWADRAAQQQHMTQPHMETLKQMKPLYVLDTSITDYDL